MAHSISAALLLRVGLAFTFLYAAGSAILAPVNWLGFFPAFVFSLGIPENAVLASFSVLELIIGVWLLSGWKVFWPALIGAGMLGGIVVFNLGAMDIVFRDLGLLFAALALAQLSSR